jgi:hypothetical protein
MSTTARGETTPQNASAHRPSILAEFARGPWLPVVATLVVVALIVLVPGGPIDDVGGVLQGLAAVIVALTGLVTAAARFRR